METSYHSDKLTQNDAHGKCWRWTLNPESYNVTVNSIKEWELVVSTGLPCPGDIPTSISSPVHLIPVIRWVRHFMKTTCPGHVYKRLHNSLDSGFGESKGTWILAPALPLCDLGQVPAPLRPLFSYLYIGVV